VRVFLPHFVRTLQDAAATFNQSATGQLHVEVNRNGNGIEAIQLRFDGCGFAFRPTGKGAIQVDRIDPGNSAAHALLRPRLNRRGTLKCWREQQQSNGGDALRRTTDELCEHYLLHTVRSRLVSNSKTAS